MWCKSGHVYDGHGLPRRRALVLPKVDGSVPQTQRVNLSIISELATCTLLFPALPCSLSLSISLALSLSRARSLSLALLLSLYPCNPWARTAGGASAATSRGSNSPDQLGARSGTDHVGVMPKL